MHAVLQRVTGIEHIMHDNHTHAPVVSTTLTTCSTPRTVLTTAVSTSTRNSNSGGLDKQEDNQQSRAVMLQFYKKRRKEKEKAAAARMLARDKDVFDVLPSTSCFVPSQPSSPTPSLPLYSPQESMPCSLKALRDSRRRLPIWDTLMTREQETMQAHTQQQQMEYEQNQPSAVTNNLRAALSMKSRTNTKAPLNSMLVNAYPCLSKMHRKCHAGRPRCSICGDRGHHMYSCPFNPDPHIERRRLENQMRESI